jgi:hypothetical protein
MDVAFDVIIVIGRRLWLCITYISSLAVSEKSKDSSWSNYARMSW